MGYDCLVSCLLDKHNKLQTNQISTPKWVQPRLGEISTQQMHTPSVLYYTTSLWEEKKFMSNYKSF